MSAEIGLPKRFAYLGGGQIAVPQDVNPIVRDLFRAMNTSGMSMASLAEMVGISEDTLRGWRKNHVPRLDNIEAALNGVGLRLAIVPMEDDKP